MITLILGGNTSGKSAFGITRLEKGAEPHIIIATGRAMDGGFRKKLNAHRWSRPAHIHAHEVVTDLTGKLHQTAKYAKTILIDSLDFWIFSLMQEGREEEEVRNFLRDLESWSGPDLICITAEINLGPLPMDSLSNRFAGTLGRFNQQMAGLADHVYFVVSGCPMELK